jgi:hypothetical protein
MVITWPGLHAIAAAGKYKSKFKASELENDFQVDVEGISDEHILHSAVGILRRDIEKLKISETRFDIPRPR